MKYEIIDNFLDKESFKKIKDSMLGSYFPWFLNQQVSGNKDNDGFYFTHFFYKNFNVAGETTILLEPLLLKIKPKAIIRIKGNLYPQTHKIIEHGNHVDYTFEHKGFIFYINSNDGFTKLKDGTIIESIENRGLFFDPSIEHNSSTCTNEFGRININFNYF